MCLNSTCDMHDRILAGPSKQIPASLLIRKRCVCMCVCFVSGTIFAVPKHNHLL